MLYKTWPFLSRTWDDRKPEFESMIHEIPPCSQSFSRVPSSKGHGSNFVWSQAMLIDIHKNCNALDKSLGAFFHGFGAFWFLDAMFARWRFLILRPDEWSGTWTPRKSGFLSKCFDISASYNGRAFRKIFGCLIVGRGHRRSRARSAALAIWRMKCICQCGRRSTLFHVVVRVTWDNFDHIASHSPSRYGAKSLPRTIGFFAGDQKWSREQPDEQAIHFPGFRSSRNSSWTNHLVWFSRAEKLASVRISRLIWLDGAPWIRLPKSSLLDIQMRCGPHPQTMIHLAVKISEASEICC
jgi:hypothetical protein